MREDAVVLTLGLLLLRRRRGLLLLRGWLRDRIRVFAFVSLSDGQSPTIF